MAWYCGDGTNGDELYLLKIIERDGARDAICARFAATSNPGIGIGLIRRVNQLELQQV